MTLFIDTFINSSWLLIVVMIMKLGERVKDVPAPWLPLDTEDW